MVRISVGKVVNTRGIAPLMVQILALVKETRFYWHTFALLRTLPHRIVNPHQKWIVPVFDGKRDDAGIIVAVKFGGTLGQGGKSFFVGFCNENRFFGAL